MLIFLTRIIMSTVFYYKRYSMLVFSEKCTNLVIIAQKLRWAVKTFYNKCLFYVFCKSAYHSF